ncbi:MAG: M57 family metalloprotease [Polyangiales bacterium]
MPDREAALRYYEEHERVGRRVGTSTSRPTRSRRRGNALTQATFEGTPIKWPFPTQTQLTYCVDTGSFGSRADELLSALDSAAESWSRVVNVRFLRVDVPGCDNETNEVVFNVRRVRSSVFNAAAFFPNQARADRELQVTKSAFTETEGGRTLEGILRHELGHVLGFRHEHIWASCVGTAHVGRVWSDPAHAPTT